MAPYELTRERVRENVEADGPGFYRLGHTINGQFYTSYVGRSDNCLRTRLERHADLGWYTHFVPRRTSCEEQAYYQECLFYHLEGEHIVNIRHPCCPDHTELNCPYCAHEQQLAAIEDERQEIYNNVA